MDASPTSVDAGLDSAVTLEADIEERLRDAHTRFGAKVRTRIVGKTYVLVEVGHLGALFDQVATLMDRALPRLFDGRFTKHPDLGVRVVLFGSHEAYAQYCSARYPGWAPDDIGAYRRSFREIAADVSGGGDYLSTLTHEMVHPLIETDFPKARLWLDEGIASLFDAPVFGDDGSIRGMVWSRRHAQLLAGLASPIDRGDVRLDALFAMTTREFKAKTVDAGPDRRSQLVMLHYAMARSVCSWLDEQGKLWPFYRAWRDGYAADPTGEKAFARVMGGTPMELNAAWLKWAK